MSGHFSGPFKFLSSLSLHFLSNYCFSPLSSLVWSRTCVDERFFLCSEYMLWTDASSREFIANEYPWFIDTYDSYTYPIQRADAIRYFILHHFGGVYLDLDVGCRRPLDRLLVYPVILPRTIPVGVSNDLMFAEKGHPFMAQTIHNLVTFDHNWVLNYPTVMFSTGPMFLSAQYGFWTSSHTPTREFPGGEVRILPKSLYGKNAKPEDVPHAFFSHYYGSSWHDGDAAFIGFLGKWGKGLMYVGFILLVIGVVNLLWRRKSKKSEHSGRYAGYDVLLPRSYHQNGRWHLDLGPFILTTRGIISSASTSTTSVPASPLDSSDGDDESVSMLPLAFDVRPSSRPGSPSGASESSLGDGVVASGGRRSSLVEAISRAGSRVIASITGGGAREGSRGRSRRRSWNNRGVLFFLPATLLPSAVPVSDIPPHTRSSRSSARPYPEDVPLIPTHHQYAPEKAAPAHATDVDLEEVDVHGASSSLQASQREVLLRSPSRTPLRPSTPVESPGQAPPPYIAAAGVGPSHAPSHAWQEAWDEWGSR